MWQACRDISFVTSRLTFAGSRDAEKGPSTRAVDYLRATLQAFEESPNDIWASVSALPFRLYADKRTR